MSLRPRRRAVDEDGRVTLRDMLKALGLKGRGEVTVVPIGKGLYVAPITSVRKRRQDGNPTTDELLRNAIRGLTAR